MLLIRTFAGLMLTAIALCWAPQLASAQSAAPDSPKPAAVSQTATVTPSPSAAAASKAPASSGSRRRQLPQCVKEGASCAAPQAKCCGNLVCLGTKNSFCAAP
jgi:hypothetical protein